MYTKYHFDNSELDLIKVDITFYDKGSIHPSLLAVEWAKSALNSHPEIKPIMQVMKRYLQYNRLNIPFNGKHINSHTKYIIIEI